MHCLMCINWDMLVIVELCVKREELQAQGFGGKMVNLKANACCYQAYLKDLDADSGLAREGG